MAFAPAHRFLSVLVFAGALLGAAGCIAPAGPALAQETARDHNLNARMGRMELASENVDPAFHAKWLEQHRDWGTLIRIADSEVSGTRALKGTGKDKGPNDLLVFVKLAWYRADEGDLHATVIRQRWSSKKGGGWLLAGEDREAGEPGLFGDFVPPAANPDGPHPPKKFTTTTLTGQ